MVGKRAVTSIVAILSVALIATYGLAFAHGWGGHGGHHGDRVLGLLARAGGVSGTTIRTAFKNNAPTLKADFQAVHADKQALVGCLTGGTPSSCSVSKLQSDQQKLESDKLAVWQTIFSDSSFKPAQAQSTWTSLQNLEQQKHNLLKGIFGSPNGGSNTSATEEGAPQS
jgi:hypothetical protein